MIKMWVMYALIFFVLTRLISVVGGKYTKYAKTTLFQDLFTSLLLATLLINLTK